MKNRKTIIYVFNLSLDLDNPLLATTNLWVNEFALNFEFVHVYSTHVGRYFVSPKVTVTELGGGSTAMRIIALTRLMRTVPKILRNRKKAVVFHHQSPRTSIFPGLIFRLFGVKQGLWYSHSKKPISLTLGSLIVDKLYSSSPQSLPLKSKKQNFLGHGIDTLAATKAFQNSRSRKEKVLFVGRIDPIKRLEDCVAAIGQTDSLEPEFVVIGPSSRHPQYLESLKEQSKSLSVKFTFQEPIPHEQVFTYMADAQMYYAGMRNSVDKSCLEAAASGCFVLTTDEASSQLSTMSQFWHTYFGLDDLPTLSDQIGLIQSLDPALIEQARSEIQQGAVSLNSVATLINSISKSLVVS
jgi:glycosyltransferase involved in cell wall biosynthesis